MNKLHLQQKKQAAKQIKENGTLFHIILGPVQDATDPWKIAASGGKTQSIYGVFTASKDKHLNGAIVEQSLTTVLCVPEEFSLTSEQIQGCTLVRERDNMAFNVKSLDIVAPGDVEILYKIQVTT